MKKTFHFRVGAFCANAFWLCTIAFCIASISAQARDVRPQDITVPNRFSFTSDIYFVDKNATNAIISVDFSPGDRSWTGSVDFYTTNGTAQAGIDYEPTNGTLNFSGPGTPIPVIAVPILDNNSQQTNVTVELFLSNANADIPRPHATLVIVDTNQPPSLQMSRNQFGVSLFWPAIYDGYSVEKSVGFSKDAWSKIDSIPTTSNGFSVVADEFSDIPVFYRLRKTSAP